ncbi:MFS transporter [Reyranella soli]|uniref:MFS transporter n=1 Tax=Reyranella soli TaxID=1230389 RepID=A0A512N9R2_9HYPH|nr:MFS transporter [Reyranella soli]GEP55720.1 MFS transporter [Reyranella soli]
MEAVIANPRVRSPGLTGALVAFSAFVGIFATTPGQTVGVSSFIDPIAVDLGLAREHVLLLYSIGTFLGILTAPMIGRLVDRFGPRRLIAPIVVALAIACGVMSVAWNAWSLAAGFVLLRATAIAGLSLVSNQMVNLWFDRFRGRIIALTLMGMAIGGLVVPPFAEGIIQSDGWRTAYLTLGAGVFAIMMPVGLALYRNRPADRADRDFGRPGPSVSANVGDGLTLGEAAGTTVFWYLTAITLLVNAVNTALLLDHVRAMSAAGLDRSQAIALLGAVTTMQAVATLATGMLVDRFGARPVGLLGLAMLAASVLSVMAAPGLGGGLVYAVTLGAMIGMLQVVHSSGLAESFGTAHLGTIKGTTFVVGVSGAAAGPLPLLWSPTAAYWIFLGLTLCGAALGVLSLRRRLSRV